MKDPCLEDRLQQLVSSWTFLSETPALGSYRLSGVPWVGYGGVGVRGNSALGGKGLSVGVGGNTGGFGR